jgi:hypothetical protein
VRPTFYGFGVQARLKRYACGEPIPSHQRHAVSSPEASLSPISDRRIASLNESSLSLKAYSNEQGISYKLVSLLQTDSGSVFAMSSPVVPRSPHRDSEILSYASVHNGIESSSLLCVSLALFLGHRIADPLHSLSFRLRVSVPSKLPYHVLGVGYENRLVTRSSFACV